MFVTGKIFICPYINMKLSRNKILKLCKSNNQTRHRRGGKAKLFKPNTGGTRTNKSKGLNLRRKSLKNQKGGNETPEEKERRLAAEAEEEKEKIRLAVQARAQVQGQEQGEGENVERNANVAIPVAEDEENISLAAEAKGQEQGEGENVAVPVPGSAPGSDSGEKKKHLPPDEITALQMEKARKIQYAARKMIARKKDSEMNKNEENEKEGDKKTRASATVGLTNVDVDVLKKIVKEAIRENDSQRVAENKARALVKDEVKQYNNVKMNKLLTKVKHDVAVSVDPNAALGIPEVLGFGINDETNLQITVGAFKDMTNKMISSIQDKIEESKVSIIGAIKSSNKTATEE